MSIKSNCKPNAKSNHCVDYTKKKLDNNYTAKVLIEQVIMLCNIAIIEVGDTKIEENIEEK